MKNKLLIGILCMILLVSGVKAFSVVTGRSVYSGSFDINNFAPVINAENYTGDAGDVVQINYSVTDPNGDNVIIDFTSPFNDTGYWNSTVDDYGIWKVNITASDGNLQSNYSIYVRLSPYCGDGSCDSGKGETCANCPEDCGICDGIINTSIEPYDPAIGYNVSLDATISSNFTIDSKYANITLPNGSVVQVDLAGKYSPVIKGRHNVTFIVNDTNGNIDTFEDYFIAGGILVDVQFNAIDYNLSGIPVNLSIFFSGTEKEIHLHSFKGIKLDNHTDILYDLYYKGLNDNIRIRLNCVNLSLDRNETIGLDRLNDSDYLVVYGINNTYDICDAVVRIYYDNLNFDDEGKLNLNKCDDWDFTGRNCIGGWMDITSQAVQNIAEDYFEVTVNSFSGFSIGEEKEKVEREEQIITSGGLADYYCGDGICTKASAVGEDCGNCPEDCGECPVIEPADDEEEEKLPIIEEEKPKEECTIPELYMALMIILTVVFSIILIREYYKEPKVSYESYRYILFLLIILFVLFLFLMYCPLAESMLILQFILFSVYILYENREKIRIYYKTKTNKKIYWK